MPQVKSVTTLFFENLLPVLKKRTDVHMIWLVYQPEKLNLSQMKNSDMTILDIHDYKNAIEILRKEKPDIIYASPYWNLIDYALSSAGKFLSIPIVSGFYNDVSFKRSQAKAIKSHVTRFFESSVPTDTTTSQKKLMRRGRFFIYKYLFLLRTQFAIKMNILKIIRNFFTILKLTLSDASYDSRFANTLHWLEGENLITLLVKAGFERSSLVVTGNPMYDPVFQKLHTSQISIKTDHKIRVLLVTTALYEHGYWTKNQRDMIIKEIVRKIHLHKNEISLIVKIHPSSEILEDYQSLINEIDSSIPIFKEGDIMEFIENSDVVISFPSSSALLYALLAKKPIIECNFFNLGIDILVEKGLTMECTNASDVVTLINQVLSRNPASAEKVGDFVKDFLYKPDGHAAERICDEIINLLEKKHI